MQSPSVLESNNKLVAIPASESVHESMPNTHHDRRPFIHVLILLLLVERL